MRSSASLYSAKSPSVSLVARDTLAGSTPGYIPVTTAGAIALNEISFPSFQSRIVPNKNIYFAGHCIDIDGITEGSNCQHAWTSGLGAGKSAALILASVSR